MKNTVDWLLSAQRWCCCLRMGSAGCEKGFLQNSRCLSVSSLQSCPAMKQTVQEGVAHAESDSIFIISQPNVQKCGIGAL